MAAKYQLITELYRRTGVSVAKSPQAWQSFLSSACRNYKCRFDEQLLIYAQRPDAVAVAELGTWNKLFKRWVNKDSKGIAVFDPKGRRNTLKYYFDISDTHEGYYGSRPVPIWQMDERYEQAVKERLSDRFGELEETDLAETLFKTAENAVEDNLPDYLSQLKGVTQEMLGKPPQEIYDAAYQIALKNDIAECFSETDYSPQAAKALLKSPNLLQEVYDEWLETDHTHMEDLRQTITDFKDYMVKTEKILSWGER